MSAQPLGLYSALLPDDRAEWLARALEDLDPTALHWVSGYAAGLAARALPERAAASAPIPVKDAAPSPRLTIVYGSQTGNAKREAERVHAEAGRQGLNARLVRADAYPIRELATERLLYVVISTQGDGDPPDDARGFVDALLGKRAPRLPDLKFAVLGLGDSSYPQFNAMARRLDARLEELGATRLVARAEADLDIDAVAAPWREQSLALARWTLDQGLPRATVTPLFPAPEATAAATFQAEVLVNQRITGRHSGKDVRHVELDLAGSGIEYEPGDSLALRVRNSDALVDSILSALRLDAAQAVTHAGRTRSLGEWLAGERELTRLSRPVLAAHAARAQHPEIDALVAPGNEAALRRHIEANQFIDLLEQAPAEWTAQDLVATLRPIATRAYSIASSRKEVGEEAHLTVALLQRAATSPRWGAASRQVGDAAEGARFELSLQPNDRFRVPTDTSRDLVMIGAGTGIAPYRGFLQERRATGAGGRHWLVFGNPHQQSDFLYQLEWQRALKQGELHRLDLAFSRDQADKVYVQHRIEQQGKDLYDWLERGAHLYVCGDASGMAKDVHAALVRLVSRHGGVDVERAEEYLSDRTREGRYARDVY